MKGKATLVILEQLVMVLVFALAAALCLNLFAQSSRIARDTARQEAAAQIAQNAAELLKAGEDPARLDTGDFTLTITQLPSELPGYLARGLIGVSQDGQMVFCLETAWQEVGP